MKILRATATCLLIGQSTALQAGKHPLTRKDNHQSSSQAASPMERTDGPSSSSFVTDRGDAVSTSEISRRKMLSSVTMVAACYPLAAHAFIDARENSLEEIELGKGSWQASGQTENKRVNSRMLVVPSPFATYAARILLKFDRSAEEWWRDLALTYALLPPGEQRKMFGQRFGSFAASVQASMNSFIVEESGANGSSKSAWEKLFSRFVDNYGGSDPALRQICMLFSLLPKVQQPSERMQRYKDVFAPAANAERAFDFEDFVNDYSSLLPANYGCRFSTETSSYSISPPIDIFEVGIDEEFGQAVTATTFGPLSEIALSRDLPDYPLDIYALFGVSGAAGCALTHSVVIPLDVVKTKAQTNPEEYADFFTGLSRVVQEEGLQGLLTGAQATLAGYFWYGLSVYPSYTFFKRFIGQSLLPLDFSTLHTNDIALIAGALSAVLASLGLTPLEAARIRVVADPIQYRSLGLFGTLNLIASEDETLGWKALYAGLPALMTRQVIFGSIKFLAFERACDAIFLNFPSLRDATSTALAVSLVAGAFSGALSSFVSQPADTVLTYVAQRTDTKGSLSMIQGCQLMVEESGVGSLFRGLGSRSLWAAAIIAGQFLLYDVFRTAFGVTADDLTQVYTLKL